VKDLPTVADRDVQWCSKCQDHTWHQLTSRMLLPTPQPAARWIGATYTESRWACLRCRLRAKRAPRAS